MSSRNRNAAFGIVLGIVGAALVTSGAISANAGVKAPRDRGIEGYIDRCVNQAEAFGFDVGRHGDVLLMTGGKGSTPDVDVNRLSALLGFCPTHQLSGMCAGQGCGEAAFTATLTQKVSP